MKVEEEVCCSEEDGNRTVEDGGFIAVFQSLMQESQLDNHR